MSSRSTRVPCGLYRTTRPIGDVIPTGALVFYHNHGDPGPGVYLPADWDANRAVFSEQGQTVPDEEYAQTLEPLEPEGLYRVVDAFYCCEQKCQHFEEDLLVQLGYNGDAEAILFVPEMAGGELHFPEEGTLVDDEQLANIRPLKVPRSDPDSELDPGALN